MNWMMRVVLITVLAFAGRIRAQTTFEVKLPTDLAAPVNGRLVVHLVAADSSVATQEPAQGPFWTDPQPIFGVDIRANQPGQVIQIDAASKFPNAFPRPPAKLPAGQYVAQAVLDLNRVDSSFSREGGNRVGPPVSFEVRPGEANTVVLTLQHTIEPWQFQPHPPHDEAEEVVVPSNTLGDFHRCQPVLFRVSALSPINYDPRKRYAAVYDIPGFGGRHDSGHYGPRWNELRKRAFVFVLDPESPNGHTLFCDSRVNGPWATALIEEVIPALEAKYRLIKEPWARIVTGHSSGGWSSLWLGTQYPETFGAVWSSAPDPVDFRRFELINIYEDANAYVRKGIERPAARFVVDGEMTETMTVREENGGESVLGPQNTSSQQWDSWMACWGTPDPNNPRVGEGDWPVAKPLFNAETGEINPAEAEHYKAYDIRLLLANDPERYVPVFRQNVRLVCGTLDNYYLNEAVELLKAEVDSHPIAGFPGFGYIKLIEGADHGMSLMFSPAMRAWPAEMVEHLRQHGME